MSDLVQGAGCLGFWQQSALFRCPPLLPAAALTTSLLVDLTDRTNSRFTYLFHLNES
jgi:hypothetical protein